MSSVPPQREFINEQVTPAGETFTEWKEINVKMEEEMEDQRRLMDFTRIPQIILHRIDLPRCCVCKRRRFSVKRNHRGTNSSLMALQKPRTRIRKETIPKTQE
ncbi:uncharacterized protein LOC114156874 isoform X9 [Xiphophorus couchianus]|uniref:uncharacterized protein LOC114156874 isoform X9 n=1 Tax=Xiphophorus couchianus TaxID=32473 RepID=UPI0010168F92|nr:uncharacterized protein LOC114156874 isoform X9 [Xiphophorus couchianus]